MQGSETAAAVAAGSRARAVDAVAFDVLGSSASAEPAAEADAAADADADAEAEAQAEAEADDFEAEFSEVEPFAPAPRKTSGPGGLMPWQIQALETVMV